VLYSFFCTDKPDSLDKRLATRPKHVERLKQLQQQGRLVLAGPNPNVDNVTPGDAGFSGSLIVAEFDSLKLAQAWAQQDPYIEAGVYSDITVKPFVQAFP